MANGLVQIERGVQRWALAFVGGKDTGDQPKSCFNCPFLYINQKRCQIHGPDIIIDRVQKDGQSYVPVCVYQRGGTPLAVADDKVVYNVNVLGDKAADQTGLEWAKSPTGTNCGGFNQGAPCEHFSKTHGNDGICTLMSEDQDETSNAMSEHKGNEVDWDDCCDGHEGEHMKWREAQSILKGDKRIDLLGSPKVEQSKPDGDKLLALFVRHGETGLNKENRFRGQMEIPLNDAGKQQALDVRRFLVGKELGPAFRSSKDRTRETADLVLGPNKAKVVKNFDALNVGKYSGEKKTDKNMKEMKHYQENPDIKIPDGERINDFRARTNPEIKMAISEGEKAGKPSISFVHSSTIHQVSHLLHNDHNAVKVRPGGIVGVYKRPNGILYARALLHESNSKQDQQLMS